MSRLRGSVSRWVRHNPVPDGDSSVETVDTRGAVLARARIVIKRLLIGPNARDNYEKAIDAGVLSIGVHSYGRPNIRLYQGDTGTVKIGYFCAIAEDVELMPGGGHRTDWVSTYPFRVMFGLPGAYEDGHPTSKGDIVIGNDVWIGRGAKVLSGVRVGHGAVIGAYAVVASEVRPYAVVVGNPAREVRRRFSNDQVDALLRIAWWDWPEDVIRSRISWLSSGDVDGFISRYGITDTEGS